METKTEIRSAIEELSMLTKAHSAAVADVAHISTKPFLHVCTLILQVLDKIGPTMAVLRQDIHQNIQRLEILLESDPTMYSNLIEMLKKEESEGNARKGSSCSKAFLWLTRSMDFMAALLQRLVKEPEQNMEQAVQESYNVTLKPRHGWISSAAFKNSSSQVALKLVPDNKTFISLIMKKDQNYENLKEDMQTLISLLVPLLEHIHSILRFYRLDRLKSS
ncbi:Glycolipid transfer protein 3 [Hibiscus syriacus]|uniref:Glycolipid transfer protein 3 n=1 Tax=Hibiscus syriacus TaxID=106335 RepID=A0A6A3AG32_HIBSY|nr:Glycolipid transfer protein 3 [Hibiscus syriacus]